MIVYGMSGHHITGRNKFGKHVGQVLMVSDYNNVYTPRLVLEPLDNYFTEIHAMKLARELVEIFNEDKPIKTWENYEDELMVYHAKHEGTGSFLFLSTKDFDFQIGYLPHVADKDNITLANLICHMLNGKDVDRFEIIPSGDVIDREDLESTSKIL